MATRTRRASTCRPTRSSSSASTPSCMEEFYQQLAGLDEEMGLAAIYAEHARLFSPPRSMRCASGPRRTTSPATRRASCWPSPCASLAAAVAELTERIETAEAQPPSSGAASRSRTARFRTGPPTSPTAPSGTRCTPRYLEAEEALNPMRQERLAADRRRRASWATPICRPGGGHRGFDPDQLGAEMRAFLAESETPYFAALRRLPGRDRDRAGRRQPRRPVVPDARQRLGPLVRCAPHAVGCRVDPARPGDRPARPAGHRWTSSRARTSRRAPSGRRSMRRATFAWSSSRAAAGTTTAPSCTRPGTPSTSCTSTRLPVPWRGSATTA